MSTNYYLATKDKQEKWEKIAKFHKDLKKFLMDKQDEFQDREMEDYIQNIMDKTFTPRKNDELIHIGKRIGGAVFLFNSFRGLEHFKKMVGHTDVIVDEYGREISVFDLVTTIEDTKGGKVYSCYETTEDGYQRHGGEWC